LKTCDEKQLYVQNIQIKTVQIQGSADGQRLLQTFEAQFVAGHLVKKGHSEIPLLHRLHNLQGGSLSCNVSSPCGNAMQPDHVHVQPLSYQLHLHPITQTYELRLNLCIPKLPVSSHISVHS
jgi:hypothetical protein